MNRITVDEAERLASELVRNEGAPNGLDPDILLVQLSLEKIAGVAEIALMLLNQHDSNHYVLAANSRSAREIQHIDVDEDQVPPLSKAIKKPQNDDELMDIGDAINEHELRMFRSTPKDQP